MPVEISMVEPNHGVCALLRCFEAYAVYQPAAIVRKPVVRFGFGI
jgi:hypothetical protein